MTTTTHSPGPIPEPPALDALRTLLAVQVVFASLLAALVVLSVVVAHPLAVLLFGVGRLGAAVAERI